MVDYGDDASDSPSDEQQVTGDAAQTVMSLRHLLQNISLPEKIRTLRLQDIEAISAISSIADCTQYRRRPQAKIVGMPGP